MPDAFLVIGGVVVDGADGNFCLHGFALLVIDIIKINVYEILYGMKCYEEK